MARFILKWRYIKSGSAKHGTNLVKYIATREGVEKCDESWKHQSATTEQQRLIKQLTEDFPDAVNSFEYQDYINAQTKSTASEFISRTIEENLDLIGKKENYVGYIAMRPRVEKQGAHGLFSQTDRPIDLSAVSKEVAEHEGAVWTTIMSLRREDAQQLGYDNAKAWRDLLRGQANKLAKAMGISLGDLRWYAAFHNEGRHPHIHLISYSVGKEPYIQGFALIYSPKCSIILLEGSDIMAKNYLLIYSEQLATEIELLCQNLKAPSNTLFQIRKSSSSVYANIREANYGQSKSDMISKFEISLKECTETEGWLKLLFETNIIDEEMFRRNRNLCGRIRRMLISSCKTLKDNK